MPRLAKFLSHDELEWLYQAQDVPEKYVVCGGDSDWAGSDSRRSTKGVFEQFGQHFIEFSCSTQHIVALLSGKAEMYATVRAAAGGLQSVQLLAEAGSAHGQYGENRHAQPCWIRASTTPGCEVALDSRSGASWAVFIEEGRYLQRRERIDDETPR